MFCSTYFEIFQDCTFWDNTAEWLFLEIESELHIAACTDS